MSHLLESDHLAIATNLEEALKWRKLHPEARVLGGGTEVLADQTLDLFRPKAYLHLGRIEALQQVSVSDTSVRIGAGVTLERLTADDIAEAVPLLKQVALSVGTPQARRRGTVGGNLGGGLPDRSLAPALLVLDCTVQLQSIERGERSLPLQAFLQGRGATALGADELITSVQMKRHTGFQRYTQVAPRAALVYPTVATALVVNREAHSLALGIANAAPTAFRPTAVEKEFAARLDWQANTLPEGLAQEFGDQAAAACSPIDDQQASAAYRSHAIAVMARRLLEEAFHP